jgi:hypothetical protein
MAICEQCGGSFPAKRSTARYCSSVCRQKAFLARSRAMQTSEDVELRQPYLPVSGPTDGQTFTVREDATPEPASMERELDDLTIQFREARANAREWGISTSGLKRDLADAESAMHELEDRLDVLRHEFLEEVVCSHGDQTTPRATELLAQLRAVDVELKRQMERVRALKTEKYLART